MFDERFARQYRDGLPPEFPQTSPFIGIVHHLSGPSVHAHAQTHSNRFAGNVNIGAQYYIYCAINCRNRVLAHTLDSLVRVSRRVEYLHVASQTYTYSCHKIKLHVADLKH